MTVLPIASPPWADAPCCCESHLNSRNWNQRCASCCTTRSPQWRTMRQPDRPYPKGRPTSQSTPTLLPGLIATVRDHIDSSRHGCLEGVSDAVLSELITVVFFGGLET